jgi:hypothetical protein
VVAVIKDWDLIDLCEMTAEELGKQFASMVIPHLLAMAYVSDLKPRDVATACVGVLTDEMPEAELWSRIQMEIAELLSKRATGEAAA